MRDLCHNKGKKMIIVGVMAACVMGGFAETIFSEDGVVLVRSEDGRVEYAKVAFPSSVESNWVMIASSGSGLGAQRAWREVGDGRVSQWYAIINDGERTYG